MPIGQEAGDSKKVVGTQSVPNKVSLFARSSTVSASFGYNLYNMPIIKNLCMEDYNLLNIKHSKDRPYFFGLGIPSRFNCNYGFHKKAKSKNIDSNQIDPNKMSNSIKLHKKADFMRTGASGNISGKPMRAGGNMMGSHGLINS